MDLTGPLLDVIAFHPGDPQAFPFFEMPPKSALQRSSALLRMLSAVDDGWQLTKTGEALARLPLSPRAGRVLLAAAARGVLEEAALAVALLEDDRTFERGDAATRTDSDIGEQVARFEALLDHGQLRGPLVEAKRARDDLLRAARDLPQGPLAATRARALKAALLAGFPDRLCRRRRSGEADAVMVGGRGVRLARESGVLDAGLFLALHLTGGPGNSSLVRVAEAVDLDLLREVLPEQLSTSDEAVFDEDRGAFVGVRRTRFWDLVIEERSGVPVDPAAVAQSLAHAFSERFERLFRPDDDAVRLRDRIRFAAFALADADGWPDVSNAAIQAWLPELCEGKRTLDDVARINWQQVFEEKLSWQQRRLLDEVVPDRIEVPTGNHIRVDYGPALTEGGAPILAVRLQELFGLLDTPRVARGRIVVVLHLLSPGYKPVQVTKDLRSFWQNGYPEVKRELRARYPRHSWPEDPLTAEPTARARRRP